MQVLSLICCACFALAWAQDFTQRGFFEQRTYLYPQTAPGDRGRVVSEAVLRWEVSRKLTSGLRIYAEAEARTDTHRQTERLWRANFLDRRLQRPAFSLRRLSAIYHRGSWTIEAGKQFIRWGKADILNPTDRFAPRDFINVADSEFLGVTAVRLTYERNSNSLDVVWQPVFTPSRAPLINQRWTVIPRELSNFQLVDGGYRIPGGAQWGARFNHRGLGWEGALTFYEGHNHLPLLDSRLVQPTVVQFARFYPHLRQYGADVAVPLRWFTMKGEAAWQGSRTASADEFILWVAQAERQVGELSLVAGYAGEVVTARRNPLRFAPDRGLARAFLARAGYTLSANSSVAVEMVARQNGEGAWAQGEYSRALGQHWRMTARAALIRGQSTDFLGQYRRNSHALLILRYSF